MYVCMSKYEQYLVVKIYFRVYCFLDQRLPRPWRPDSTWMRIKLTWVGTGPSMNSYPGSMHHALLNTTFSPAWPLTSWSISKRSLTMSSWSKKEKPNHTATFFMYGCVSLFTRQISLLHSHTYVQSHRIPHGYTSFFYRHFSCTSPFNIDSYSLSLQLQTFTVTFFTYSSPSYEPSYFFFHLPFNSYTFIHTLHNSFSSSSLHD